jgi:RNA recognition motif-containing protein
MFCACLLCTLLWPCDDAVVLQSVPGRRVYVGSLDYTVNEAIIRQLFSPFGTILSVDMPIDPAYVICTVSLCHLAHAPAVV